MRKCVIAAGFIVLVGMFWSIGFGAGALVDHSPIVIEGDYQFTVENGVVSGSGTVDDPYVIEGWRIDAGYNDYGIRIHRTTRYFIIRNVEISGAGKAGISLSYVKNGVITDSHLTGNWIGISLNFSAHNKISSCTIESNGDGIHFYFSHDNQIIQCTVTKNDTAIWLDGSNGNDLIGNTISANYMGVYLDLGAERNLIYSNAFIDNVHNAHSVAVNDWDYNGQGNYWSDYCGIDADENGIGDAPYVIRSKGDQDNYPLLNIP